MMKTIRLPVQVTAVLLIISAPIAVLRANEPACRVRGQTFAEAVFSLSRHEAAALHARLAGWGKSERFDVGGVGMVDPAPSPGRSSQKTILQTTSFGVVLTVETNSWSDQALVEVKNNCWADQEDWKPYWQQLGAQLSAWGYTLQDRAPDPLKE